MPEGNLPDRIAELLQRLDAALDRLETPAQIAIAAPETLPIFEPEADRRPERVKRSDETASWLKTVHGIEFVTTPEHDPESIATRAKAFVRLLWKGKNGSVEFSKDTGFIRREKE